MLLLILATAFPETLGPEDDDRLVTLHGRNFSFQVLEPAGWVLDTVGAPQIANFIFHPEGTNWRHAEAVILARFVSRKQDEVLSEFVRTNRERFLESCPFGEEDFDSAPIKLDDDFDLEVYDCPGVRKELTAISSPPGYFVVLTLSLQSPEALEKHSRTFKQIVDSFSWKDLSLPRLRLLPPDPDREQQSSPRP